MTRPFIDILPVLLLLGAAQGAFLVLVLAGIKRGNRVANRFLACLLLLYSICLVRGFMSVTYTYRRYPGLIGIDYPILFMYGPLIYFYVKSLTEPQWQIKRLKLAAHFIPAFLYAVYLIPLFLLPPEIKGELWYLRYGPIRNYSRDIYPIPIVVVIQIAGYLILSLRLLKSHSRNIRQNFSSIENINLTWLKILIIVLFCLLFMFTFYMVFSQFFGIYKESEYIVYLMIAVLIYVMGYKGIRQPEIFTASDTLPAPLVIAAHNQRMDKLDTAPGISQLEAENKLGEKYKKSALTDEQSGKILAQLTHLMEKEKPYLEMGLTLPMLSKMLDVSPHHLSQVINEKLDKSYFDFVNEYRIEEAKKALVSRESKRFSILGIAMDAGFNSKSAFYTAFKRHTGMTPSQFKERGIPRDYSRG